MADDGGKDGGKEGGKDGKGGKAVLQVSRRTWDTEEYQKRADERREEEEKIEAEVRRIALPAFRPMRAGKQCTPQGKPG